MKMGSKRKHIFLKVFLSVLLIATVILNVAAIMLKSTFDQFLGTGEKTVVGGSDLAGDYYTVKYDNAEDAKEAGYLVAAKINEEGSVLLKNNGVLPLEETAEVMPFGYAFLRPVYGQSSASGSAKWADEPVTPRTALTSSSFVLNENAVNHINKNGSLVKLKEAEGTRAASGGGSMLGGNFVINEFDPSGYEPVEETPNATALVFIARGGQEGTDVKSDAYEDGTPHYLALTEAEKGMIRQAKRICENVVLILNSSAPMELGCVMDGELEVDAILWIGHPGNRGFSVLPQLLNGTVNPSGRTVDIWTQDFTKDPSYQSIGENRYTNYQVVSASLTDGGTFNGMYNEYMEGVYMGYRYYETAALVDPEFQYEEAVVFPFGYGLSYTTFEQELVSVQEDGNQITAKVLVTNTGNAAGKEVVQLYYSAPYTQLDVDERIEKPACNLVAFAKTDTIQPGKSEELTLTFTWDDMTSYAAYHNNGNGTVGSYMLEAGEYTVSLRQNSHVVLDEEVLTREETIWYDGSDAEHIRQSEKDAQAVLDQNGEPTGVPQNGVTFVAATNLFQISTDYMNANSTILSRSDWSGIQPVAVTSKAIDESFLQYLGLEISFDPYSDERFGNVEGSIVYSETYPVSAADNGLQLSDMRGLDYNDPQWELYLDQIDWEADRSNIIGNHSGAAYLTFEIQSIGLPVTKEADGANGLKVSDVVEGGTSGYVMNKTSTLAMSPLLAATWNTELLYEVGEALGQEALQHGITGWYSPAINLHRSVFSGRVFEYFSEDPVLSGYVAAAIVSGAMDQGLVCYLKHFAMNDNEIGRASLIYTWADEQTMRELYLKAFEIAVKNAKSTVRYYGENGVLEEKTIRGATAVMAAQTCFGWVSGECNYELLTLLLRNEWGFRGVVLSDYWVWNNDNLRDLALRSGCDTYLSAQSPVWSIMDYDSATARTAMRNSIHNIAYAMVNSNVIQGVAPGSVVMVGTSPWIYALIVFDAIVIVLSGWLLRLLRKK